MREVIRVDRIKEEEVDKPVEFTGYFHPSDGLTVSHMSPKDYDKVIYLGNDEDHGDMFCAYRGCFVMIYKGHLNSGKY